MKQTAVEWLVEELKTRSMNLNKWNGDLVEQAKEMEKQQIVDAHGSKLISPKGLASEYWVKGEDYYNKTFKSK